MAVDLGGVACSTGSACANGSNEPSHVLMAMGFPEDEARGALRLSLGRTTTTEEIDQATRVLIDVLGRQREAARELAEQNAALAVERAAFESQKAGNGAVADSEGVRS